jgi:hypothetical protein
MVKSGLLLRFLLAIFEAYNRLNWSKNVMKEGFQK